jgi:hydrogenase nickel incorporation protein HypA/HybF
MHEAAIAQAILETALTAAGKENTRITRIVVVAGALAGLEQPSLELYLTELSRGTPAEGATLEVKATPARLVCRACGHATAFDSGRTVDVQCSSCGGPNRLEADGACYLESIEVES